nr:Myb_DNA-bind_3 domain-containing protein [Ipomoea batatas]GMD47040.1 Myb_DNA-bind_3 domain-containing protein [Ipomoea batatas]
MQYLAIQDMLNKGSGFGWNDTEKCITATKDVFEEWVKSHPTAAGLRNKPFPYLDELMTVWGNDHASIAGAETPANAVEELDQRGDNADGFQIMNVGEHILKDAHKLDTFFALPKELRRHYVVKQLFEIDAYHPTFDFHSGDDV